MISPVSLTTVSRREGLLITTCLALVLALAWAYLVHLDRRMSLSPHETLMAQRGMAMLMPWTAADVFFAFMMWTAMMVGMMAGPAAPVLLVFGAVCAGRGNRGVTLAVLMFGLGYFTAWVGFSACAAIAQWTLQRGAMLTAAMSVSNPRLSGAILIAAGTYQLLPFKGACLEKCRHPLGFVMTHWRDGNIGAIRMGLRHGAYCVGCCGLLMSALFVVGVMNLAWVAVLSAFVLFEKIVPAAAVMGRIAGATMIVVGVVFVTGVT